MAFNDEIMVASGANYDPEHPSTEKATLEKTQSGGVYKIDDPTGSTISDDDYFPFYDSSESRKKKSLWSTIVDKLKSIFLSLTGGTISGDITYKFTDADLTKANNNVSSVQYPTTFNILDVGSRIFARMEGKVHPNGDTGTYWYIRNYNTSGAQVGQKGIEMRMTKDGTFSYLVEDEGKFRSAIHAAYSSANNGVADNATKVNNWYSSRPTSANVQFGDGFLRYFLATSSMSEGKPTIGDGHIIDLAWDYNNGYDVQLAIGNGSSGIQCRGQVAGVWQDWLTFIHSGNIGSQTVNSASTATTAKKLGRGGDAGAPMTFYWTGKDGQPPWLWGGSDGANMYVYNPSNFSVKRAKELNYATDTTDLNTVNGNGWYSIAEAKNAIYSGQTYKPLAINWYWGIDIRTRGVAYAQINGHGIITSENIGSQSVSKAANATTYQEIFNGYCSAANSWQTKILASNYKFSTYKFLIFETRQYGNTTQVYVEAVDRFKQHTSTGNRIIMSSVTGEQYQIYYVDDTHIALAQTQVNGTYLTFHIYGMISV